MRVQSYDDGCDTVSSVMERARASAAFRREAFKLPPKIIKHIEPESQELPKEAPIELPNFLALRNPPRHLLAPQFPTIARIVACVGMHYEVSAADMASAHRFQRITHARQVAMYLARKLTPRSMPDIGARMGGRDHTTVLHAVNKITGILPNDEKLAADIARIEALIVGCRDD